MWTSLTLGYHLISRLAYVVGVGVALTKQEREQFFTRRYGVDEGFRRFRRLAATLMNNDAVSFFVLCVITRGTTTAGLPAAVMIALGWVFVVVGIGTKVWAARRIGPGYYWRNFFAPGTSVAPDPPGPYRYMKNPMYTVGYSHMYGFALMMGSLPGLLAAAFDQTSIMVFYYLVEKPHYETLARGVPATRV